MNYTDVIRERRSIRKYKTDQDIPQEHLEQILEAAMMAPSARNTRPWEFYVIKNAEIKEKIIEISPYTSMLKTAPVAIVVCGRPDLQEGKCTPYWPQDCGAAAQNILLQAKALGYGTCWCGIYPNMPRVEAMKELLNVTCVPVMVVALGVPDEEPFAKGYFDPERVTYID